MPEAAPKKSSSLLMWRIRQFIWSNWLTLRHGINKPRTLKPPDFTEFGGKVKVVTMSEKHGDGIPLPMITTFDKLPRDEVELGVLAVQVISNGMNKILRPMQSGLPEVPADGREALDQVLTNNYRRGFRDVALPEVFANSPADGPADLGTLAVASPYAFILQCDADGRLIWDFTAYADIEHHAHVHSIALVVVFEEVEDSDSGITKLSATSIESNALGTVQPGDDGWALATRLAVCAASTMAALTRHFHYVHLVCAAQWALASRNELPAEHAVFRMMWPFNFNALYTNFGVTEVQMLPDGDFENMFSFTHKGLIQVYEKMHPRYRISLNDPYADWKARGLQDSAFEALSQRNAEDLFDVMHAFATRYIDEYYASDEELAGDKEVVSWLTEVDALIPNGISSVVSPEVPTCVGLARLLGGVMYEGNTVHDMVGTTLWDYQLWADHNPTRMHIDGSRIPIDVLHRVIMCNFALQLVRAPMLADHGGVALDDKGRACFTRLFEDCTALQEKYDAVPADIWRMEPKNLEISMNG